MSVLKPQAYLIALFSFFFTSALTPAHVYTSTLGQVKLGDDLVANQFNALVIVLSLSNLERDFKLLLSFLNLQAVFVKHKDFIIPSMPRLHFESRGMLVLRSMY